MSENIDSEQVMPAHPPGADRRVDPTRRLLYRYIAALALLAIMITTTQIIMQRTISMQRRNADAINIGGKQRMLSQRSAKAAYALYQSVRLGETAEARRWASMLSETAQERWALHQVLRDGDEARGLDAPSPTILARLRAIEPQLVSILERCEHLLSKRRTGAPAEWYLPDIQYLADHDEEYLQSMDAAVSEMVDEHELRIHNAENLEAFLAALSLIVLVIEAFLVFEPARRALKKQLRELEAALHAAKASERAKQNFLTNMSHEIRTPMNAIVGYARVLAEDNPERALREEALDSLMRSSSHLLQVINDVLDIAKLDNEIDVTHRTSTPVADTVLDVVSLHAETARARGIKLRTSLTPPVPARVQTDPARVRQILANLVGNAIKYTEKGSVTISVSCDCNMLRFQVIDTGVGIPADQIERIFAPFTQADSGLTRRFGGTGLGLAIARRFAESLSGDISVTSTPGQGSIFTLSIPAELDADEPQLNTLARSQNEPPEPVAEPAPRGTKALLVEDGPDNQRLVSFLLKKLGLTVVCAENGLEGVRAAEDARQAGEPFGIIFMDMQMPVMDGYTATARLRELGHDTPIIALTAHAMQGDRDRCLSAGCNDYLTKPITRERLAEARDHWITTPDRIAA